MATVILFSLTGFGHEDPLVTAVVVMGFIAPIFAIGGAIGVAALVGERQA